MRYANVIVDISAGQLDRYFQYRIPPSLVSQVQIGTPVYVPFGRGNRRTRGYIVELTDRQEYEGSEMKELSEVIQTEVAVEDQLVQLAVWMKQRYGSTLNQCLKTVMPVKEKVRTVKKRFYELSPDQLLVEQVLEQARKRSNSQGRVRVLEALQMQDHQSEEQLLQSQQVGKSVLKGLVATGVIREVCTQSFRTPSVLQGEGAKPVRLNDQQKLVVEEITARMDRPVDQPKKPCLIHGITGSGKTEVYMELIAHVLAQGRQAIVLIPEIALTYQTVMRFYRRFGDQVATIHSRLSAGERFDQFERARQGLASVMIGPRSALFTPFPDLGLIVIDEEHESAYKSETMPRYHAREVAVKRAEMAQAMLVLGSATPSMESYHRAISGTYELYCLTRRASKDSILATTHVVDMRKELEEGNRSIFSGTLQTLMEDRLARKEQILLFLNRRGYNSVVSCRSCGEPIQCPHCDVALTAHIGWRLNCHYCGYSIPMPKSCPACGSPYISGFGLGTEKVQILVEKQFPGVRTLRMDMDTTSRKEGHQDILSRFGAGEADILIGTQMIVKGHDFPNVTLMGILAADMSLHSSNYMASERTFQLLTQAAGRAGRGSKAGDVVIQTYSPDHYSIQAAARQDYGAFYGEEMKFRQLMQYPPVMGMMAILVTSAEETLAEAVIQADASLIAEGYPMLQQIGPTAAPVSRMKDIYRKLLYVKSPENEILLEVKQRIERLHQELYGEKVQLIFDLCE